MTYVGRQFKELDTSKSFDAIVIGSGMGGLSVSSVLAQKGRRVLLLEQHNVIGGCTHSYARNGYEWNVGLHYIGDLHSPRTMTSKLFNYIAEGRVVWDEMPEVYNRIIIDGREYPFTQGEGAYVRFLKECFPMEHKAIDRYMELLTIAVKSSRGFFAEKALPQGEFEPMRHQLTEEFLSQSEPTTYEVLSGLTDNQELIAVICGNYGDYSLPPKRSSFAMHAMLVRHYYRSAYYPRGGASSLAKNIVPTIERAGGQAVYGAEVKEILLDDTGAACGVRLANGQEIESSVVISNAGVQNTFAELLPEHSSHKQHCTENLAQVVDAYCAVGLNIGLKGDAKTLGLTGANIWAHPGEDLDRNVELHKNDFSQPFPWAFITFPSAKDSGWSERFPGKSTIEMFCATDFSHFQEWSGSQWKRRGQEYEAFKEGIAQRMFAELFKYVPQVEPYVDYYEVSTPVTYQHFLRRRTGNFMGIESSPQRFKQAWLRADTPVENLFLTGQDVTTDGVISALMAGVITASRVLGEDVMSEIALAG